MLVDLAKPSQGMVQIPDPFYLKPCCSNRQAQQVVQVWAHLCFKHRSAALGNLETFSLGFMGMDQIWIPLLLNPLMSGCGQSLVKLPVAWI